MHKPVNFVRSIDRPLPSSMLWLGAVVVCVEGVLDSPSISFHAVACEDPSSVGFAVVSCAEADAHQPGLPRMPSYLNSEALPPESFTGHVFLGAWNLDEIRSMRMRAARAALAQPEPGPLDLAVAVMVGPTSSWLAMSRGADGPIDRLLHARDAAHAAKQAKDLPGTLVAVMPLDQLAHWSSKLEAAARSEPHSPEAVFFLHRSAEEAEIEFSEFSKNHVRSPKVQALIGAVLKGAPLPNMDSDQQG